MKIAVFNSFVFFALMSSLLALALPTPNIARELERRDKNVGVSNTVGGGNIVQETGDDSLIINFGSRCAAFPFDFGLMELTNLFVLSVLVETNSDTLSIAAGDATDGDSDTTTTNTNKNKGISNTLGGGNIAQETGEDSTIGNAFSKSEFLSECVLLVY